MILVTLLLAVFAQAFEPEVTLNDKMMGQAVGIKASVFKDAAEAYKRMPTKNDRYLAIVDFSQPSKNRRFYLFDLKNGTVERHNVAAGAGSDKNGDGIAEAFDNVPNSHKSSLGAYLTAETYVGKHGLSLRLDGQDPTNSKARARGVVVHGADYVKDGVKAGRSWGCPALDMKVFKDVINKIKGGALLYIGR